jgi:hypothetical protein
MPVFVVCGTETIILLRHELPLTYIVTSSLRMASPPKAGIVKPAGTAVAGQWLNSRHVLAATDMQTTIKEWLETVFPARFVPALFNQDQLPLRESLEASVIRV